jgi:hypothetical protein
MSELKVGDRFHGQLPWIGYREIEVVRRGIPKEGEYFLGRGTHVLQAKGTQFAPHRKDRWIVQLVTEERTDTLSEMLSALRRVAELEAALREVRDAIVRADPDVLTDTLWMPEDVLMGATVVDRIDIALEEKLHPVAPNSRQSVSPRTTGSVGKPTPPRR